MTASGWGSLALYDGYSAKKKKKKKKKNLLLRICSRDFRDMFWVVVDHIPSTRGDRLKNMAASGRGIFVRYTAIVENLLRIYPMEFNASLQGCSLSNTLKDLKNYCLSLGKHGHNSAGLLFALYNRTSMARTSSGPWKFVRDMGSSNHWGLIMAPVQEANSDNLGIFFFDFLHKDCMLSVLIRIASMTRF